MKNFYFLYIMGFCLHVYAMQPSDFELLQEEIENSCKREEESCFEEFCFMDNHITPVPVERIQYQPLSDSDYELLHNIQAKNDTKGLCTSFSCLPPELIKRIIVDDIGEGDMLLWEEFKQDPYGRAMVKLSNAMQSQQKLPKKIFPLSLLYKTPTSLQQLYGRLVPVWIDDKIPNISLDDEVNIIQYMPKSLLQHIGALKVMCQTTPSIAETLDHGVQCASIGLVAGYWSSIGLNTGVQLNKITPNIASAMQKTVHNTYILRDKCPASLFYALGIPALMGLCGADGLNYFISKATNQPMDERKGHYKSQAAAGLAVTAAAYAYTGSPSLTGMSHTILWSIPFATAGAFYGIGSSLLTKKYTNKKTIREIKQTRIIQ